MKQLLLMGGILLSLPGLRAQEIVLTERAPLEAVYGEVWESDDVLPMNELGIESGYLLYETEVELPEGGAELAWSVISGGHADEYFTFVAPKIIGGGASKGPVGGKGFARMEDAMPVDIASVSRCGCDWLIHGFSRFRTPSWVKASHPDSSTTDKK